MAIQAVILAAGQGKRMHSRLPKVLHKLAGKPLLEHVIAAATTISPEKAPVVIFGHEGHVLQQALAGQNICWVEQTEQLGTGHALLQALPMLNETNRALVLYGDVPMISETTLRRLIDATPPQHIGMLTADLYDPTGYGRIKRENGQVVGIVEEKDASVEEREITEVNTGIYLVPVSYLKKWLPLLKNQNAQKEYYLTDIIGFAVNEQIGIHTVQPDEIEEVMGVNDRLQLATLERFYQELYAEKLMRQGVTLLDPLRLDVRGEVFVGRDVTIDVNVILEGKVVIGDNCIIGSNTILRNVQIANGVEIKANSMIDGADIASNAIIGPFARIRPGTVLAQNVHIGNFVEIKKSMVQEGTKINHLSYVGDSEIGKGVNVGAGVITCNYDGVNKHQTIIGDGAFIGSCSQLVAPVTVGEGATIGAGSTITRNAPAHQLTLTRSEQVSVSDWRRPVKENK